MGSVPNDGRRTRRGGWSALIAATLIATIAALAGAAPAAAAPVATSDPTYEGLGAIFPDPQGGCALPTCDPAARGNAPATSFIQIEEFFDALDYMNTSEGQPEWAQYMEVLPLDGQIGANADGDGPAADALSAGDTPADAMFPGNTQPLEFDPDPDFRSAGLPQSVGEDGTGPDRLKSDLVVVRVTNENVPDDNKKRYALSLSIHGIERAGAEGGIRAMEDLVTAATTASDGDGDSRLEDPVVPAEVKEDAPTFGDVLRDSIIYFTFPNPDGWRRGSFTNLFPSFQRYNGNGVDPNRDWPDIGYSFRGYSAASEPETQAFISFYSDTRDNGGDFAAGDDLHGQPNADALSYTLLPHGSKDFQKDLRAREVAKRINRATFEAINYDPRIQENDQPTGGPTGCAPGALGPMCPRIYAQTWGTVYDTINYTTVGSLGDWFDSPAGLNADGIDNEMSFSHLDRDIVFKTDDEQLHVAGNKALIYGRLVEILEPPVQQFDAPGRKGYVANSRVTRTEQRADEGPPPGTVAQATFQDSGVQQEFEFPVKNGPQPDDGTADAGKDIFNGGMRVEATTTNVQGTNTGMATLDVQCRNCNDHRGSDPDSEGWITVAEDFNQSFVYRQAGLVATVNRPQAEGLDGQPVEWRAVIGGPGSELANAVEVIFSQGPASADGDTGGGEPSRLAAYDVANTDFFADLDRFDAGGFDAVDPRAVIEGRQSLGGLTSLVLADDPLPGYTGRYEGETQDPAQPTGEPTADQEFQSERETAPGQGPESCRRDTTTTETKSFVIEPDDGNASLTARVTWGRETSDYDIFLSRIVGGERTEVGSSAGFLNTSEEILLERPPAGEYELDVVNCSAPPDDRWSGTLTFEALEDEGSGGGGSAAGTFSEADKNAWMATLREYVGGGGNLVLTDGALRALPELSDVAATSGEGDAAGPSVTERPIYAGQVAFDKSADDGDETTEDPLATDPVTINQLGARFNSGMRRQTYEPSPLGFFVDSTIGSGAQAGAVQYDIDRAAFETAGGRVAGTGASSQGTNVTQLYDRVTLGELPQGEGQIRVLGALLPQPTQENDHPLGLAPHGVTYTGYIVMRNLLQISGDDGGPGGPGGDDGDSGGGGGPGDSGGGGTGGGGGGNDGSSDGGSGDDGNGDSGGRRRSGGVDAQSCFRAATTARGNRVGRAGLARSRATVRETFGTIGRYRRFVDRYCLLDGGLVRIAYATPRERQRLSRSERRRIGRESIFVLTTSKALRIRGVRRGMGVRALHRRIGRGARVRVGKNLWYFRKGRNSRHIFKIQRGRVREMGIADARLTNGRKRAKRFFRQGR